MPITKGRKAIRFKALSLMFDAIKRDDEYQYRHLVIAHAAVNSGPCTRREITDTQDIPANAISKVTDQLVSDGILKSVGKIPCPISGRTSSGLIFNHDYQGEY